jgi:hypothetical protein
MSSTSVRDDIRIYYTVIHILNVINNINSAIKSSPATSRVRRLSEEKANVSRTISVLVFRVLMCLENQSVSDIGLPEFHGHACTRPRLMLQTHHSPEDEDRDGPRNVGFVFA